MGEYQNLPIRLETIEIKQGRLLHVPLASPHGVQAPAIGLTTFAGSGAPDCVLYNNYPVLNPLNAMKRLVIAFLGFVCIVVVLVAIAALMTTTKAAPRNTELPSNISIRSIPDRLFF